MKKWLKQLFCSHIFKNVDGSWEHLRSTTYENVFFYDHYAVSQLCVKCEKEKIIEVKNRDYSK